MAEAGQNKASGGDERSRPAGPAHRPSYASVAGGKQAAARRAPCTFLQADPTYLLIKALPSITDINILDAIAPFSELNQASAIMPVTSGYSRTKKAFKIWRVRPFAATAAKRIACVTKTAIELNKELPEGFLLVQPWSSHMATARIKFEHDLADVELASVRGTIAAAYPHLEILELSREYNTERGFYKGYLNLFVRCPDGSVPFGFTKLSCAGWDFGFKWKHLQHGLKPGTKAYNSWMYVAEASVTKRSFRAAQAKAAPAAKAQAPLSAAAPAAAPALADAAAPAAASAPPAAAPSSSSPSVEPAAASATAAPATTAATPPVAAAAVQPSAAAAGAGAGATAGAAATKAPQARVASPPASPKLAAQPAKPNPPLKTPAASASPADDQMQVDTNKKRTSHARKDTRETSDACLTMEGQINEPINLFRAPSDSDGAKPRKKPSPQALENIRARQGQDTSRSQNGT